MLILKQNTYPLPVPNFIHEEGANGGEERSGFGCGSSKEHESVLRFANGGLVRAAKYFS